jgi:hypothetical protein
MERDPHFFTIVIDVHMAGTARRALDMLAEPIVPDQNLLYRDDTLQAALDAIQINFFRVSVVFGHWPFPFFKRAPGPQGSHLVARAGSR